MFGNNVLFYNAIKTKALSCLTHSLTLYIDTNTLNHRSKAGNIYSYLLNIYLPDTPSSWHMSGISPPCLALRAGCSCLKENIIWVACPLHVARDTRVLPDWGVAVGSLDNLHDSSRVKMVTIILGRSIFWFIFQIYRENHVLLILAGVGGGDLVQHPGHPAAPGPAVAVARHVHAAPRHALAEIFSWLEIFFTIMLCLDV